MSSVPTYGMSDLGYKIFLDRYALKDMSCDPELFKKGLVVLAKFEGHGRKEIYRVSSLEGGEVILWMDDDPNTLCSFKLSDVDVPIELDPLDMYHRVSKTVAETEEIHIEYADKYFDLLSSGKFVPGGRILASVGNISAPSTTCYNCYVIPSPKDSKDGIFETLNIMSQLMSIGGGVGINISTLRPRNARTFSTNGRSSGAVNWGEVYSFVNGLIEQGGSRRGALMLILDVWHPDILEFIKAKRDNSRIVNANISVNISDAFMRAVKNDEAWHFFFPDFGKYDDYDEVWDGDIDKWCNELRRDMIMSYESIPAREIWDAITESAWESGEPGIVFMDQVNEMSNSHYLDKMKTTNPCGEQPLPDWGVCCLGSLNLPKFLFHSKNLMETVDGSSRIGWIDFSELSRAITTSVRFMDSIIDISSYYNDKIRVCQLNERRMGIGTMGLAELLIRMKIRYGSKECFELLDELYGFIRNEVYSASIDLANEKGSFPGYTEDFHSGKFIQSLPSDIQDDIRTYGTRNIALLSQAPTGTIGTMMGTSTGIEPYYDWVFHSETRLGKHIEIVKVYEEFVSDANGIDPVTAISALPEYFVTAYEVSPKEHVLVQTKIQEYMDSAVSKTVNLPSDSTVGDVGSIYTLMYESGCKGGTVYRDKSRDVQVLVSVSDEQEEVDITSSKLLSASIQKRPEIVSGSTISVKTSYGTVFVTMNILEGRPFEVFVTVGKAGSDIQAVAEAIGRLISMILRIPSGMSELSRLSEIIDQLSGIGSNNAMGFGKKRILSLPDGIASAMFDLSDFNEDINSIEVPAINPNKAKISSPDFCPKCGNSNYHRSEGCKTCLDCGYSQC